MASITTILGTDSVSSSRIVINNNFAALNQELADLGALLVTTTQTLTLSGLITGGALRIKILNGAELFTVDGAEVNANVPIKLNQDTTIGKGLMHSVYYNAQTLPAANAYEHTTYILDAGIASPLHNTVVILSAANNGQEITLISDGGIITIGKDILAGAIDDVEIADGGSLTLRWSDDLGLFIIVSSFSCMIQGVTI